ncbi:hypothetical protein [Lentzea sp. NPDC003310]|uniref:hypothetical protein n=1 Tax=Lentzea sp. NPDC003310 TaxID=3154447 RepID=UPI0033A7F72E
MPELLGQQEFVSVPSYRLMSVRDYENDAGVGFEEALDRSQTEFVASTGYELVVNCASDLTPVAVRLEAWSGRPAGDDGWSVPQVFELECPTGLMVISIPTGGGVDLQLPAGRGIYAAEVVHRGREEKVTETYRVRMWLVDELPEYDEDDD